MAEWTYALVSVAELKDVLSIGSDNTGQDAVLEAVAQRASEAVESYCQRQFVVRSAYTEFHSLDANTPALFLRQYPIATITSVKEGAWVAGTWTAALTLTAGTDYLAASASGRLQRLSGGGLSCWQSGLESVQVVYTAGYANTAAVPGALKEVALGLAARKYSQIRRGGDFSAQTVSDGLGSVSRFLPAELLKMEKEQLSPWVRVEVCSTGRVA
jgi:hypothetical protein